MALGRCTARGCGGGAGPCPSGCAAILKRERAGEGVKVAAGACREKGCTNMPLFEDVDAPQTLQMWCWLRVEDGRIGGCRLRVEG